MTRRSSIQLRHAFDVHRAIDKTGPTDPKIPAGLTGIANFLGVLEHSKVAVNVTLFVRDEYFLYPKSGTLQKVSRESVPIDTTGLRSLSSHLSDPLDPSAIITP